VTVSAQIAAGAPSRDDEVTQLLEPLRPDPGNGVELVGGAEGAVLRPVIEDLLARTAQPRRSAGLSTSKFYCCSLRTLY